MTVGVLEGVLVISPSSSSLLVLWWRLVEFITLYWQPRSHSFSLLGVVCFLLEEDWTSTLSVCYIISICFQLTKASPIYRNVPKFPCIRYLDFHFRFQWFIILEARLCPPLRAESSWIQVFTMADLAKCVARTTSKYQVLRQKPDIILQKQIVCGWLPKQSNGVLALCPTKPVIRSVVQVRLLAASTICSGLYFGLLSFLNLDFFSFL